MKTYQLTLEGYNGSTDATDHLIKWVNAPDEIAIRSYAAYRGWVLQGKLETPFDRVLTIQDGVEAEVDMYGTPVTLHIDPHFSGVQLIASDLWTTREEELYEVFEREVRMSVLEALDSLMEKKGVPSDFPERQYLIGATDADLSHLFPALDQQARLLWERGVRAHTLASLKTSSSTKA